MSRFANYQRSLILPMLLLSYYAYSATQEDELLVDPTMPLDVQLAGDTSGGFDIETGISDAGGLFTGLFNSYELGSVLIRGDDRIAVINEQRVREGDNIGNATVISIETDSVTLNVDGEIEKLELYENSIKTLVKGAD